MLDKDDKKVHLSVQFANALAASLYSVQEEDGWLVQHLEFSRGCGETA